MARANDHPLDGSWKSVLDQLGEAVIVLDEQRILRHVNDAARRLLGYEKGQAIGGRCKLTTRGVDCENACPLTFALDAGLDRVEDFATVYRAKDGRSIRLRITVVPLTGDDGEFRGAVEILRPADPDPGFYLCGRSQAAQEMRQRALELARTRTDVALVGDHAACRDVARAMHRFSGAPSELFYEWNGSWDGTNPWPPGTVYADGEAAEDLLDSDRPEGWRLIVGFSDRDRPAESFELFELASLGDLAPDLGRMLRSWFSEFAPSSRITSQALDQLGRLAADRGLEEVEKVMQGAASGSGECVDLGDLPLDGYRTAFVDELLQAPDPLAALEERLLREVLNRCGWRMQEAADRVGISRVTLWRKMKDLGIERP